ncbi:hypothetical protein B6V01_005170 [Methanosarcinales archaeon ex4572_44]|nr:MAG: hypothetical protein B6V01_005170 [Methanosarcinales archaeon ex4572_44]
MGLLFMNKDALVMLGCPKFPVQTSLALYMGHKLVGEDILPVFAGNKSAIALLEIADPEGRYRGGGFMDLDDARAIHNPLPLKEEIDGVNRWLPV